MRALSRSASADSPHTDLSESLEEKGRDGFMNILLQTDAGSGVASCTVPIISPRTSLSADSTGVGSDEEEDEFEDPSARAERVLRMCDMVDESRKRMSSSASEDDENESGMPCDTVSRESFTIEDVEDDGDEPAKGAGKDSGETADGEGDVASGFVDACEEEVIAVGGTLAAQSPLPHQGRSRACSSSSLPTMRSRSSSPANENSKLRNQLREAHRALLSMRENATLKYSKLELDYKTLQSAFAQSKVDIDAKNKAVADIAAERDEARAELAVMLGGRVDVVQKITMERDTLRANVKDLTEEKEKLKEEIGDLKNRLGDCNCLIEDFGHKDGKGEMKSPNKFIVKTLESLGDESLKASSLNLSSEIDSIHRSIQRSVSCDNEGSTVSNENPPPSLPTIDSPVERTRRHSFRHSSSSSVSNGIEGGRPPRQPLKRLGKSIRYFTQHMSDETVTTPSNAGASVVRERLASARLSAKGGVNNAENDTSSAAKILQDIDRQLSELENNNDGADASASQNKHDIKRKSSESSLSFGESTDQLCSLRDLSDRAERQEEEAEKKRKAKVLSNSSEGESVNRRALFGSMKLPGEPNKAKDPQEQVHRLRPFSTSLRNLGKKWQSTTSLLAGEKMDEETSFMHTQKSTRHLRVVPTLSDERMRASDSLRHGQATSSRSLLSEEAIPEDSLRGVPRRLADRRARLAEAKAEKKEEDKRNLSQKSLKVFNEAATAKAEEMRGVGAPQSLTTVRGDVAAWGDMGNDKLGAEEEDTVNFSATSVTVGA